MEEFLQCASKLEAWCREQALPFWAGHVLDPNGGAYEQLLATGEPDLTCHRRVRVQARLAYVYAHATDLGWYEGAEVSNHAWDYVMSKGLQGGGFIPGSGFKGCAHLLHNDGRLKDGMRDTYAQAFLILAGAWRYRAFQDGASKRVATDTITFLDTIKADNGGWLEGVPASLPRRQNPHMHLFEALMALYDATQEEEFLVRAGDIYQLFVNVFFDESKGVVREFFDQNWKAQNNDGGPIEPGHMFEWVWLLRNYQAMSGVDVDQYADVLYAKAKEYGYSETTGLIRDKVDLRNRHQPPTYRTWPQTEFIKAGIAQARMGRLDALPDVTAAIANLLDKYFDVPAPGGWVDCLDANGKPKNTLMPTSTFYHIISTAAEASAFAKIGAKENH
ncbi:MAG: AGE family epimerase/isomerase [Robiginitomaculum sp.]|nr:AGE family epimerase/isomerase [Robiginitomaculum sp.]